jgi:cell division protein FtsW (lipid II flippase)
MPASRSPLNLGVALLAIGLLLVFRALVPMPAPENPSSDHHPRNPAARRIIAAVIGLAMLAAGAWFIKTST